jgi:hypothetical protein
MGDPGTIEVPFVIDEDLGLVNEAPKGVRVDDPVAIALEFAAKIRFWLRVAPPARALVMGGIRRERLVAFR